MSLEKVFNLSTSQVKELLDKGAISTSVKNKYEIYDYYQEFSRSAQATGKSKSELFIEVAEKFKCSESWVRTIYYDLSTK